MSSANATVDGIVHANDSGASTSPEDPVKQAVYEYAVPMLVLACVISTLFNSLVLVSLRWLRRSINPTLSLSLSLTFADGYASFMCGLGFVINSYLPVVNQSLHQCFNLVLEALRLSGLVAAALNLLALSFNHYLGILRPLHYASTVTRRSAYIGIVFLWALPLMLFFTYFSSVPGQGFQSNDCADLRFLRQKRFSVLLGMLFTIPLVVMMFIYLHIFFIIRQHKLGLLGQGATTQNRHVICKKTSSNASVTTSLTSSTCIQGSRRLQNVKAVYTTLLIIGTYLIGWMPAVCYYVFTCTDSCPFPITEISLRTRISMGVLVNALIVLKSLTDPFIYAARMPEISEALCRMFRCRPRTSFRHIRGPSYSRKARHYNINNSVPCMPKSSLGIPMNGEAHRMDCTLTGLRAVYVGRPKGLAASQSTLSLANASPSHRHLPLTCSVSNGLNQNRSISRYPIMNHRYSQQATMAASPVAATDDESRRSIEEETAAVNTLTTFKNHVNRDSFINSNIDIMTQSENDPNHIEDCSPHKEQSLSSGSESTSSFQGQLKEL